VQHGGDDQANNVFENIGREADDNDHVGKITTEQ
jgi:hypothetical protein